MRLTEEDRCFLARVWGAGSFRFSFSLKERQYEYHLPRFCFTQGQSSSIPRQKGTRASKRADGGESWGDRCFCLSLTRKRSRPFEVTRSPPHTSLFLRDLCVLIFFSRGGRAQNHLPSSSIAIRFYLWFINVSRRSRDRHVNLPTCNLD